ncbi:MAG TPA: penicillin-binding transpeptidase domain-containing protein, partial [Desulfobacteria bacterium]|nr:penicillin-binding transpeptidase domain-containing protein [Desulfobacteria bacterium]
AAEAAFADSNNFPADKDGAEVEGAMVVEDPKTGAIVTMVGGRNYSSSQSFNRAWQAERQPGSTIKPLVVMSPALAKGGYFTGTVFDDMPVTYSNNGQPWKPTDDDTAERGWRGLITMREALIHSVNVYAIKLLNDEGIDYAWNFGKNNFDLPLKQKSKNLTLALGTAEIPVVDMVQAYSAFPNNGMMATAHSVLKVIDDKGTVIVDNTNVSKKRAVSPQVAFSINDMLRSVVSDPGGTGIAAQMGNWAVAGKTGTTSLEDNKQNVGMRDAWFMGYTPDYVGGVWMGFDQSTTSRNLVDVFGGGPPARLWKQIMTIAHQNLPVVTSFDQPDGVTKITFDSKSGKTPSHLTPSRFIKSDWAIVGALPTGVSNVWYQKTVCAATGLLPGPNTVSTVTKTFLNVDRQGVYASWPWDEAQYRAPWKVCDMGLGGQSSKQPPGQTKPKKPSSPASSSPASPASPTQPNVPATQPPNTTSPNSTGSPKTR